MESAIREDVVGAFGEETSEKLNLNISAGFNFGSLLESLAFATDLPLSNRVSIRGRGDGLQMQFFFLLLAFLAKKDSKHYYLWGCEEPEIAIELAKQFDVAKLFYEDFSSNIQILLTTHSPAFLFSTTKIED